MISHILNSMIDYFGTDIRRISHALKVYGFACAIMKDEKLESREALVVELSAVLHDIGIPESERKFNSAAGKYQELEGPPVARDLLSEAGIDSGISERVCHIVGNHHSYGKIDGIDFQILVEADFLVNICEEEMKSPEIRSIRDKYFKTSGGLRILNNIYEVKKNKEDDHELQ